jgi:hypothetical protein
MIQRIASMRNWSVYSINFVKYYMKVLLEDFNVKIGRKDVLKPTVGYES